MTPEPQSPRPCTADTNGSARALARGRRYWGRRPACQAESGRRHRDLRHLTKVAILFGLLKEVHVEELARAGHRKLGKQRPRNLRVDQRDCQWRVLSVLDNNRKIHLAVDASRSESESEDGGWCWTRRPRRGIELKFKFSRRRRPDADRGVCIC